MDLFCPTARFDPLRGPLPPLAGEGEATLASRFPPPFTGEVPGRAEGVLLWASHSEDTCVLRLRSG